MPEEPTITTTVARLSAALAEVLIQADFPKSVALSWRLSGQVTGPRCPGSETIEIAFPIRSIDADKRFAHRVLGRIVIPEPNLWEAETPFVYGGMLEIRDGQTVVTTLPIEFGLKQGT